jgi:hypothetical protein
MVVKCVRFVVYGLWFIVGVPVQDALRHYKNNFRTEKRIGKKGTLQQNTKP